MLFSLVFLFLSFEVDETLMREVGSILFILSVVVCRVIT